MNASAKSAYRREERRLLRELAESATALAQPRLDAQQLYIGRLLLARALADLIQHTKGEL